jgi:hypothetical protein
MWLMAQLGWIFVATGMVTVVDFQLTIPGHGLFIQSRFPSVDGPLDETDESPDRFLNLDEFLKEPRFTESNEPLPQFLA